MSDDLRSTFGHDRRRDWPLDPAILYLNHGTVGVTPLVIVAEQRRIQDEIERQPARFLLREVSSIRVGAPDGRPPRLRVAAAAVGRYLGASGDNLALIDNATTGVNTVLQSLNLAADDQVAVLDLSYGAVAQAAAYVTRIRGAELTRIETLEPWNHGAMIDAVRRQLTSRTRLVIVDHITAESALILPVAEIVEACHHQGALVLVDGAHAPGAIPLDIESIGADFYVANLHKWGWTPRSCGVLWARPEHQPWLHPLVISWGLDQGFTTEFDCVGTRDPSPALAAPAAFRLIDSYGPGAVRAYNHDLVWRAAEFLADRWDSRFDTPETMIGTMATIALPQAFGRTREEAALLRDALLFEDRIEVAVHAWRDRLWIRISAQIYNEMQDFVNLADAVAARRPRSG